MGKAAKILEDFGIGYEMKVISAHREPDVFVDYAKSAEERGIEVIIAGAGGAAKGCRAHPGPGRCCTSSWYVCSIV